MKSNQNPPLIEFEHITVLKGKSLKILDDITLKIQEGENVAILGPNGAGKSSLIKLITREFYPFDDELPKTFRIWGKDAWDVFDLRYLLGVVSNDLQHAFTKDITGTEMVLSGFFSSIGLFKEHITAQMKKRAAEIIEFLEIGHLQDKTIDRLSTGEAKRFLIARALVHQPKALILDEPTNSLDLHTLYKFSHTLSKIAKSGTSIILVTHNLSDIIPEIKRVILMKNGKFYKDGPKEQILNNEHISKLFEAAIEIKAKDGYYYALRA